MVKTIDANMERRRIATTEKQKSEKEWEDLSIDESF